MLINFLDCKLLPKITLKPPCTDNYEVENLISNAYSDKLRGFIAYPSTKPPVELEFEFLCNVNISYIFLNTTVGNQRCSGIEIFAKNHKTQTQYVSIGRAVYDTTQGVIFCNVRNYSKSSPPPCYNANNIALYFFKGHTNKSFLNASNLKIVIFRTEKSVPCLAAVEIWGIPAKTCSQKTVDTIQRLYFGATNTERTKGDKKNTSESPNKKDNTNTFKIPDEFKDDLTYELMTIPYTLPSGKTIDHTTLEKHNASEKSFGRKPGDPFTGRNFTEGLKPILNVGLKSRIDMFLLANSHRTETFFLKRTLRVDNQVSKRLKIDNLAKNHLEGERNTSYVDSVALEQASGNTSNSSTNTNNLDYLIQRAKSGSNFISFSNVSDDSVQNVCTLCANIFEYLYELPCEHRYCRKCLLDVCTNCMCVECKKEFVRSDVKKIDV